MLRIAASDEVRTLINVFSEVNSWVDCMVAVSTSDAPMATGVLEKAYDEWSEPTEEAQDECYGDWLDKALDKAGIKHEMYYAPSDSDEDEF